MLEPSACLLKEKVAIITGGGGGIGKGISLAFAAYGAKVVVAEKDPGRAHETVKDIQNSGGQAIASIVDVRERDQVAAMADLALTEFGQVDILVNNVGDFLGLRKNFLDSTEEEWEALYRVNLKHIFLCTKAIVPQMIERGAGGSIINISTIEAFRAFPDGAVYSAFKAGVTLFTKSLAVEIAQHRIRVNAIAPDKTQTIQIDLERWIRPEQRHEIPLWIPLGFWGTPDNIAGVAVFLASDLSRFVTGTTVHADGGMLAAAGWHHTEQGSWTNWLSAMSTGAVNNWLPKENTC